MRTSFLAAGITTCFALASVQAVASTKELESAIYQVIPFNEEPYVSLDMRKAYVIALLAYWNSFDSRVPRLSPSENDWIKQELGAQGERLNGAINSREYALFSLSLDIDSCVSTLKKLNEAYADSVKAETEMFLWLGMVKCYGRIDKMMIDLRRAELSDGRYDGAFYTIGSSLIMNVLLDKVIPSAMADTMGWTISANE
ncbi:hypothetical protein [Neogemmobacter tilapiae]|uniref:DUF4919 domain-containing protein n=1 Tax=Neogemmobacter tilapiae TaxID=875041 RepID=A0A918TJU2_9RHOB|nr:hypothetical protein [Gemmobacter tilapiae]GHC48165.1 hypothetical protein GCM10007315_07650 [Gemmobacter tilapiae]